MPGTPEKDAGSAARLPPVDHALVAVSPVLLHSAAGAVILALVFVLLIAWWRAVRQADLSPIEALFDSDLEAVVMLDDEGRIERANERFLQMTAQAPEDVEGRPLVDYATGWSRKRAVTAIREAAGGSRQSLDIGIARSGGHVDARLTCGALPKRRRVAGVWALLRDITEQKQTERELEDRALRDYLTGLPNRALFNDRLGHAVQRSRRGAGEVALLYVDLDGFKPVNDSAGHAAGDEVLREVAHRLVAVARAGDTVGRIGGDEFGILLESADNPTEAMSVAERILVQIQLPIVIEGEDIRIGASVGVAMSGDDARDTDELVRRADLAMYEAKRRGGLQRRLYTRDLEREPLHVGKRLDADLESALDRDELYLEYQPIVDTTGRRFVAVEALVRWDHPEYGPVFPSVFIPVAERASLITRLDLWVLETACAELGAVASEGGLAPVPTLSLNYSARHFDDDGHVDAISDILERRGVPPGRVQLEITEAAANRHRDGVAALKGLGLRIAIDDFGTGYSSLAYLRELEVDVLKVDRSFALSLEADHASVAVVRTVLTLAEMLDVEVVIGGVEDANRLQQLEALGGRYVQGFVFGRPVAASRLPEVLGSRPDAGPVPASAERWVDRPSPRPRARSLPAASDMADPPPASRSVRT